MKKIYAVIAFIMFGSAFCEEQPKEVVEHNQTFKVEVDAKTTKKNKILVVTLASKNEKNDATTEALQRALTYTGQFDIDLEYKLAYPTKKELCAKREDGYNSVLFLTDNFKEKTYEWRLYDTFKGTMKKGLSLKKEGNCPRFWGYALADSLVTALTNNKPFASCKLVYCQKESKGNQTSVYIADFDGTNKRLLIRSKSSIIAPRWNKDLENPLVLYSKYTPVNIQLIACSMDGTETVASSFEGLNMLPAFSYDGKEVVLCLSRDGSSQLYHYGYNQKLRTVGYTRLTYNSGNNISPCFLENGNIIFCSDFELGKPHIYHMDRKQEFIERLTDGASCTCPHYSETTHQVVYSKMAQGVMQLFVLDLKTKKEKQLTHDRGHKQECALSACGNYVVYEFQENGSSPKRIASYSLLTGTKKHLTDADKISCYPSWSPLYKTFPTVS